MSTTAKKSLSVDEAPRSLVRDMAAKYHIAPEKFLDTLKQTAFQLKPGETISNEQMQMLLVIANEYNLNPFLKQIYAFPDRNKGIVPIVGVDGYIRIVNEHGQANGWSFTISDTRVDLAGIVDVPEWIECIMYRKDREHPTIARVYMAESYRPAFETKSGHKIKGPWQQYPRLMLENRAFIRAARFAFGFTGIYSEDDAERMQTTEYIDADVVQITPEKAAQEATTATVTADKAQDEFIEAYAEEQIKQKQDPDPA